MKRKHDFFLVLFISFLILMTSFVSAERLPIVGGDEGAWGTFLNDYLTKLAGPNATTLNISGDAIFGEGVNITGDLHMVGAITHNSPVEIREGLSLTNESNFATFTIYNAHGNISNVSSAFANALIFQSDEIDNPNNMEACFWDKENQIMFFCINEGGLQRATTVRRSFQIIGNLTAKEDDENFTLCEGANYVDCLTDTTGADLLVQDDIEAQSIYANENINATGNLSLGQKIIFTLGEVIDNVIDGWITITGGLNVTGDIFVNGTSINDLSFNPVVGFTSNTYDGNISNGSLNGYAAANAICNAEYSGSHFCLKSEVLKTIANGNYSFSGTAWFQNGPPGYTANADDCSGWTTDSSTYLGPFWNWDANSQAGRGALTNCAQTKQLMCCGGSS